MNYYRKKTDLVNCTDKVCFIYAFNLYKYRLVMKRFMNIR